MLEKPRAASSSLGSLVHSAVNFWVIGFDSSLHICLEFAKVVLLQNGLNA